MVIVAENNESQRTAQPITNHNLLQASACVFMYTLLLKSVLSAFVDLDAGEALLLEVCGWQVRIVFTLSKNNSTLYRLLGLIKQILLRK